MGQTQRTKSTTAPGRENNGYVVGGVATSSMKTIGKLGQALQFNGSDYVDIPDSASLNTSLVTVTGWIKPSKSLSGQDVGFVGKWVASVVDGWFIELGRTGNQPRIYTAGTSAADWSPLAYAFPINQWSFISFVYDGTKKYFYVNGTLIDSIASTGNISPTTKDITIGLSQGSNGVSHYFPGSLDDVRIYNRALSAPRSSSSTCWASYLLYWLLYRVWITA